MLALANVQEFYKTGWGEKGGFMDLVEKHFRTLFKNRLQGELETRLCRKVDHPNNWIPECRAYQKYCLLR